MTLQKELERLTDDDIFAVAILVGCCLVGVLMFLGFNRWDMIL